MLDKLIIDLQKRGGLCHVTSVRNYRKIRESGSIKPNDGSLVSNWNCSTEIRAVSLFDFLTPKPEKLFDDFEQGKWRSIITCHWPTVPILIIDRARLSSHFLTGDEMRERGHSNFVPYGIEVCYPGEIKLELVSETVLAMVQDGYVREWRSFAGFIDDNMLSAVQSQHKKAIEKRLAEQGPRLLDMQTSLVQAHQQRLLGRVLTKEEMGKIEAQVKREVIKKERLELKNAIKW
jgi:hypothetical protein